MIRSPLQVLTFLLICVWPGLALADCAEYGTTAAAQQNENLTLGCGYTGLRWHADIGAHAGFCSLVGEGTASGETAIREAELARCRPAAEPPAEEPVDDIGVQSDGECRRSEVAEGRGNSRQSARDAAHEHWDGPERK